MEIKKYFVVLLLFCLVSVSGSEFGFDNSKDNYGFNNNAGLNEGNYVPDILTSNGQLISYLFGQYYAINPPPTSNYYLTSALGELAWKQLPSTSDNTSWNESYANTLYGRLNQNVTFANVTANYFIGDGSLLTGISGGGGNSSWNESYANTIYPRLATANTFTDSQTISLNNKLYLRDTSSYVYSPASQQLKFEVGGFSPQILWGTSSADWLKGANSGFIFNDGGASTFDIRMESNNNPYMFFLDAGANKIGINKSSPSTTLDVGGNVTANYFIGDGSQLTGVTASVSPTSINVFQADLSSATENINTDEFNLTWRASVNDGTYVTFTNGSSDIVLTAGEYNINYEIYISDSQANDRTFLTSHLMHIDSSNAIIYNYGGSGTYIRDDAAAYDKGWMNMNMRLIVEEDDTIIVNTKRLYAQSPTSNIYADQTGTRIRINKVEYT